MYLYSVFVWGLGMALIEAQAAGKKCFVSDTSTWRSNCTENICKLSLSLTPTTNGVMQF